MEKTLLRIYSIVIFLSFLVILLFPQPIQAQEKSADSSATLVLNIEVKREDTRVQKLRSFLESRNSPLSQSAEVFVSSADAYNLDWRLLAAISGVESSFGLALPSYSNNAWGWGIYKDHVTTFPTFDDGIATISKALRERYMEKWGAKDIYEIGSIYAASPTWANRVISFMDQIESFEEKKDEATLPISL